MADDPRSLLEVALDVARVGGRVLLDRYRAPLDVGTKTSRRDLVTDADRASETAIADRLRTLRPDDALLAEEGTRVAGAGRLRWVCDPLDGTVNFAQRIPHWCVSVAVEDASGPVAGVVHDPLRGETFAAARGLGASLDGEAIEVTGISQLADAIVATGFAYDTPRRAENRARLDRVLVDVRGFRRMGSAALDLAYVACGRLDGFWELGLSRWDLAAGMLLVTEAGGVVTGLDPDDDPLGSGRLVAAGPVLQPLLRKALHAPEG